MSPFCLASQLTDVQSYFGDEIFVTNLIETPEDLRSRLLKEPDRFFSKIRGVKESIPNLADGSNDIPIFFDVNGKYYVGWHKVDALRSAYQKKPVQKTKRDSNEEKTVDPGVLARILCDSHCLDWSEIRDSFTRELSVSGKVSSVELAITKHCNVTADEAHRLRKEMVALGLFYEDNSNGIRMLFGGEPVINWSKTLVKEFYGK